MTLQKDGTEPFSRRYLAWLVILVVVHAAIAVWALTRVAQTPVYYVPGGFLVVAGVTLAGFGAVLAWRGACARAVACSGALLVACALFTPAVTFVVALLLLNAFVLGDRIQAAVGTRMTDEPPLHFALATLVGMGVWMAVITMTASLKIHFPALYAVVLIVPLLSLPRTTQKALGAIGRLLVQPGPAMTAIERAWVVLLVTLVVVHLFVAAKPEVGYDALAVHLRVPLLMADAHRWSFDVTRYLWAVMPLGADFAFSSAFLLGGEGAARLLNLAFAILAGLLLYALIRRRARRDVALASVCLFASAPIAYLETSTLLVENLWLAFLLGTLLASFDYLAHRSPRALCALALLAAGVMQTKVIGVIWIVPLLAYVGQRAFRDGGFRALTRRQWLLVTVAVAMAAWPYVNAWLRTGNPVFPLMNALFRSPFYLTTASFNNELFNAPLLPWSIYDLIWSSGQYIEGSNGAMGFHWLLLLPMIALALVRWRSREFWLSVGLAAIFFVGVYTQQSYLRYLLPFFALVAMLGGWALGAIADSRAMRMGLLMAGALLCAVNLRFMYTASWPNLDLCPRCTVAPQIRQDYLASFGADRIVESYLNRCLPDARVGFYALGSPALFAGYSRAAMWHDHPTFSALNWAQSADDIVANARQFGLTHIVYRDPADNTENDALREFRQRYAVPIWRGNGRVIAKLRLPPPS
ncbi:MAG: glycosyltransferase family 39 protein [Burkholderiaceae bacterium]|nr:glycosyltransferase family 39 protein [Burkholderiaceae bacterium]